MGFDDPASKTILVVDDNRAVRTLVGAFLKHAGFSVLTARDGAEAVSIFHQHQRKIDLMLTDVTISNGIGWSLDDRVMYFVDTVTAELLIESMQRVANRHLVVFVTQRGSVLQQAVDAPPDRFVDVAQAVIAHDFLRERSIVLERLERLGIHCLDVPSQGLPVALINRYLMIKQRGLI